MVELVLRFVENWCCYAENCSTTQSRLMSGTMLHLELTRTNKSLRLQRAEEVRKSHICGCKKSCSLLEARYDELCEKTRSKRWNEQFQERRECQTISRKGFARLEPSWSMECCSDEENPVKWTVWTFDAQLVSEFIGSLNLEVLS